MFFREVRDIYDAFMRQLHDWLLEPSEAIQTQTKLCERLVLTWDGREVKTVGGVDASYVDGIARAAIVVLSYPDLNLIEELCVEMPIAFPYVPGLLAFREAPAVLAAWDKLVFKPDLVMFDGQGIAHPRGLGIASHIGLWIERPTIGVAKTRLIGKHDAVGMNRGDRAELFDERDAKRVIGSVLRTKTKTNPLYVSPGHLIDLAHAIEYVLACDGGYRLPEPTRLADKNSKLLGGS
jgi:deoxyribonuclease V